MSIEERKNHKRGRRLAAWNDRVTRSGGEQGEEDERSSLHENRKNGFLIKTERIRRSNDQ
jgi:hypothetical protein